VHCSKPPTWHRRLSCRIIVRIPVHPPCGGSGPRTVSRMWGFLNRATERSMWPGPFGNQLLPTSGRKKKGEKTRMDKLVELPRVPSHLIVIEREGGRLKLTSGWLAAAEKPPFSLGWGSLGREERPWG